MLPSGTAISMPRTAGFPSNDLTRPLASIAKATDTDLPSPWKNSLVAGEDVDRQAKAAPAIGGEGGGARLLRGRRRPRRRGAADRRAAPAMARRRRAWRDDLDGGDRGAPRLPGRALAGGPERDLAR